MRLVLHRQRAYQAKPRRGVTGRRYLSTVTVRSSLGHSLSHLARDSSTLRRAAFSSRVLRVAGPKRCTCHSSIITILGETSSVLMGSEGLHRRADPSRGLPRSGGEGH